MPEKVHRHTSPISFKSKSISTQIEVEKYIYMHLQANWTDCACLCVRACVRDIVKIEIKYSFIDIYDNGEHV